MNIIISFVQKVTGVGYCRYNGKTVNWQVPIMFILVLLMSTFCEGQSPVQLATPLLKYRSVFFKNAAIVELKFAQQGTQIHYTLNGKQPTEKDLIYSKPLQIKSSFTTVKAMVAGTGFLSSETVSATFIKDGLKIESIHQTAASERFQGNGVNTLIDNEGGNTDLNSRTWLGYRQDSVEINIVLEKKEKLSSVLINCLQDHGSWVFEPEQISVFYFNESKQSFQLIAQQFDPTNEIIPGASCLPIIIKLSPKGIRATRIKIILKGIQALPETHPGKGQQGWLFIDEIKVY